MIPVNLLLIAWVWFGRVIFGVGGWFLLLGLLVVVPALLLTLLTTTVLAYTQAARPRHLTTHQAVAQVLVWFCLFTWGLFQPDFGDTKDSELSFLTQITGERSRSLLDASYTLTGFSIFGAALAWLLLLGYLVFARQKVEPQHWAPLGAPPASPAAGR
ncbi:hypothetical protein GCM10023226_30300 [Nocardioides nanhaiensis]|uniref:Uncharacterized protein n=2 Tax=Nocardioides nanhaiensis TaxID=1476871 RepID=A0ABP8WLA1_9ACTN